jgi:hypothetical protein
MTLSIKSIGSWAVLSLMLMQFIPLNRINPPVVSEIQTPPVIKRPLKKACYNCHSNETRWTGTAYIAPISWLLSSTVTSGRSVLNFSRWNNESNVRIKTQQAKIIRVIAEGPVHQRLYFFFNPEAQLNNREQITLKQWFNRPLHEPSPDLKNSGSTHQDKTP